MPHNFANPIMVEGKVVTSCTYCGIASNTDAAGTSCGAAQGNQLLIVPSSILYIFVFRLDLSPMKCSFVYFSVNLFSSVSSMSYNYILLLYWLTCTIFASW